MSSTKKIRHVQEEQQFSDDVDEKMDFINSLDHYSLEKIFMLLPICDRTNLKKVCTRWKEVCKLAWYDIKKYKCSHAVGGAYNNQLLTQSYVENLILNCGTYLQELILSKICTSSIMPIIGEHCKNLTRFEFVFNESLPLNKYDYIQAFTKFHKMKFIKIHVINLLVGQTTKLKSEILSSLPEEINEIHVIVETSNRLKTPCFFDLEKFKNLHSLTISGCKLDSIIQQISEKVTLVYLNLENSSISCQMFYKNKNVGIFDKLVNLEHIHLFKGFYLISLNAENDIFNTCKNLRYFNVSSIIGPPTSLQNWENHNNLEYLSIAWFINYNSSLKIVKYCNNLKYLSFKIKITDMVLQKLTELKNLECLELCFPQKISDESVLAISNNCKKLKHLEIPHTRRLYSFGTEDDEDDDDDTDTEDDSENNVHDDEPVPRVTVFDDLSKLKYLESLNVSGAHKFTDSSIIAIADKCKSLKNLNISHCKYITEAGLNAITNLELLQKLNVSNVKSVTNSFIIKLKGLTSLTANKCKKITDSGIIQFLKNCSDLKHLHLSNTNITIDTIIAADRETENRRNDIILYIHCIGHRVFKKSCEPIIKSKWLVVYYHEWKIL